jgi:hypothetical protein
MRPHFPGPDDMKSRFRRTGNWRKGLVSDFSPLFWSGSVAYCRRPSVNTTVANMEAQLQQARYNLDTTTSIRAHSRAVFLGQKAEGFSVWQQPMVQLRLPMLFNLRSDPFERAQHESGDYVAMVHRARIRGRPGTGDRGTTSRELRTIPTATKTRFVLGRAGAGKAEAAAIQ